MGPGSTYVPKKGNAPAGSPATTVDVQNSQATTNYTIPTQGQQTVELANKVIAQGSAAGLKALTNKVDVTQVNGRMVATAVGSTPQGIAAAAKVADIGAAPTNSTPASTTRFEPHDDNTQIYKVTLISQVDGEMITFEAMPEIGEAQSAQYDEFNPLQHPGSILKYRGTGNREWQVTVKLVSRTASEATKNLDKVNLLRSWVMPYYGQGTANDPETSQYLGAPPPVLTLSGYGPHVIGPVKVVLASYQWNWPNDIDYIQTNDSPPVPFPVLVNVTLTLKEAWSPREFSSFDLKAFRRGELPTAYQSSTSSPQNSKTAPSATSGNASAIDPSEVAATTQEQRVAASNAANTVASGNISTAQKSVVQKGSAAISNTVKNLGGG